MSRADDEDDRVDHPEHRGSVRCVRRARAEWLPVSPRCRPSPSAVIVDAVRTPLGRRNGRLRDWHPVDLAAEVLRALVDRNDLDPAAVDDVIFGCFSQTGEQALNVARSAALAAGFPESVPGTTVDRQCGSSQQAIHFAAQGVMAGAYDVVVAGGVESMSRVPMGSAILNGPGLPFGPRVPPALPAGGRPRPPGHRRRADRRGVGPVPRRPRRLQPGAATGGRRRPPTRAGSTGRSCPITGRTPPGARHEMHVDEGIRRDTSLEALAGLKPAFETGRTDHRRQLVPDHRRGGGGADHERGAGRRPRPHAPGPAGGLRGGRRRPGDDAHRAHPGHHRGAAPGRAHPRRHRPVRGQRGLRLGGAGVGRRAPRPTWTRSTSTAAPSPSATPSGARAPASPPPCCASSSAAAGATACRPCARVAAWPTP